MGCTYLLLVFFVAEGGATKRKGERENEENGDKKAIMTIMARKLIRRGLCSAKNEKEGCALTGGKAKNEKAIKIEDF